MAVENKAGLPLDNKVPCERYLTEEHEFPEVIFQFVSLFVFMCAGLQKGEGLFSWVARVAKGAPLLAPQSST